MKLRKTGLTIAAIVATYAGLNTVAHAFTIDEGIEGQWYESGIDGRRGWGFTYIPTEPEQGELFVTGYVYDATGNPYWVAGNSTVFDGDFSVDINLLYLEGGTFGPEAGRPVVADVAFGTR